MDENAVIETESDKLEKILKNIFPEKCSLRCGEWYESNSMIAKEAIRMFLEDKGWPVGSVPYEILNMKLNLGLWKIPQYLHDRVCGCEAASLNLKGRDKVMAPMFELIEKWGLPTEKNPAKFKGITIFARPGGSRKNPLVEIRFTKKKFFFFEIGGSATWHPKERMWHNHIYFYSNLWKNELGDEYLPSTTDKDEAANIVTKALSKK